MANHVPRAGAGDGVMVVPLVPSVLASCSKSFAMGSAVKTQRSCELLWFGAQHSAYLAGVAMQLSQCCLCLYVLSLHPFKLPPLARDLLKLGNAKTCTFNTGFSLERSPYPI